MTNLKREEVNEQVLTAWLAGDEVQWKHNGEWRDGVHQFINPLCSTDTEWRVKPEKTQVVDMSIFTPVGSAGSLFVPFICRFYDDSQSDDTAGRGILEKIEPAISALEYRSLGGLGYRHCIPCSMVYYHPKCFTSYNVLEVLTDAGFQYEQYADQTFRILGPGVGYVYPWEVK